MRRPYNTIQYRGLPAKRRFGVELEINNSVPRSLISDIIEDYSDRNIKYAAWAQSRGNTYWHVKEDATCGLIGRGYDRGWEVASFVGHGEDDISHIGTVAQALANAGCEVNENCGLHVHVEAADFNAYQMGILLGHYAKFEWTLLQIVPECRHGNPFCETFNREFHYTDRQKHWSPYELWSRLKPDCLSPHDNPNRWRSVNLVNFAHGLVNKRWNRKTVEFRLPECSLIDYDVKNWIRLFVNFVDWVKHQSMPDNIDSVYCLRRAMGYMGLGHEKDKFYILGKELFNVKTWLLRRYIRMNRYHELANLILQEPKSLLNEMWEPVRNFS